MKEELGAWVYDVLTQPEIAHPMRSALVWAVAMRGLPQAANTDPWLLLRGVWVRSSAAYRFMRRPRGTARQRARTMQRRMQRWRREGR